MFGQLKGDNEEAVAQVRIQIPSESAKECHTTNIQQNKTYSFNLGKIIFRPPRLLLPTLRHTPDQHNLPLFNMRLQLIRPHPPPLECIGPTRLQSPQRTPRPSRRTGKSRLRLI